MFATACDSGDVMLWDGRGRALTRATAVGYPARALAFSCCGQHLAVGGQTGRLRILKSDTLQPLANFANCSSGITVLRYSPSNAVLACGSHDLVVHLYDTGFRGKPVDGHGRGPTLQFSPIDRAINDAWEEEQGGCGCYVLLAKCEGHSATIKHLDFSLPLWNPPELRGRTVLQSQCAGHELLYFDAGGLGQARTGKQELANMRCVGKLGVFETLLWTGFWCCRNPVVDRVLPRLGCFGQCLAQSGRGQAALLWPQEERNSWVSGREGVELRGVRR